MRKLLFLTLFLMAFSAIAQKPFVNDPLPARGSPCTAIPDDGYDGTIGSMACLNVGGPTGIVTDLSLDLDIEHTWVGDLVVKIVAPNNDVLTVMSRPGAAEPADDGGAGGFGTNAVAVLGAGYSFFNGAAVSAEDFGVGGGGVVVCVGDGICDYAPAPDSGPGTDFSDFYGTNAGGNWQVCVGDVSAADTGNLCAATLNFEVTQQVVPAFNWFGISLLIGLFLAIGIRLQRT